MLSKSTQTIPYPVAVIAMEKNGSYEVSMTRQNKTTIDVKGPYQLLMNESILKNIGLLLKHSDIPPELRALCRDHN